MRAILVCVDYADLLAITLPYNRHHFEDVMVVTSNGDRATQDVARMYNVSLFCTDSFYADGATFNKWRALEEGLDAYGRRGWLCNMDADVLWPKDATFVPFEGNLYTPMRRMMVDLGPLRLAGHAPPESAWDSYPLHRQQAEFAGYSQIFHASDPVLGPAPWHQIDWKHAGGADSFFQAKWPSERKVRPPFEVLHLGPAGVNWAGRASPLIDGTIPEASEEKIRFVDNIWVQRRQNRANGVDPFLGEKIQ